MLTSLKGAWARADHRSHALLVLVLALVLRSIWAWFVPIKLISDSVMYDYFAMNLANGDGYVSFPGAIPTAFWPVGTSFMVSLLYRAFGHDFRPLVVFNVGLGVALVGLTMVLARRKFGPRPALVAGILMSIWPLLIEYTTIMASELPFLGAMVLGWVLWSAPGLGLPLRSVLVGLAFAAACYLRPMALLLPGVLAISEVFAPLRLRATIMQVVLVMIVMLICILPWSMRNYRAFGEFVLISTNGGICTWMGNSAGSNGFFLPLTNLPGMSEMNEAQRDRAFAREAAAYIREDLGRFARRSLVKLVRVHERESIGVVWNEDGLAPLGASGIFLLKLASNLFWWCVLALGIGGFVVLVRSVGLMSALVHPVVLIWAYFAIFHAVTIVGDRYHVPAIPSIACLAALALDRCCRRVSQPERMVGEEGSAMLDKARSIL